MSSDFEQSSNEIAFRRIAPGGPIFVQGKDLPKEELRRFFKSHDKNGDGVLDKSELKAAFKRLGAILPGWRASRGLGYADADGDGLISEEELTQLVKYAIGYGYKVK